MLFSCQVLSHLLQPCELQHTKLPYPSPSSGACSNSCPLSRWCHPAISFFVTTFSSCLQSFPASVSFSMNWFFATDYQSIGVLASASVLLMNIQGQFPLGLTGLIPLLSMAFKSLLKHHSSRASVLWHSVFFMV